MFCQQCGKQIDDSAQFCSHCGAAQQERFSEMPEATPSAGSTPAIHRSGSHVLVPRRVLYLCGAAGVLLIAVASFTFGSSRGQAGSLPVSAGGNAASASTGQMPAVSGAAAESTDSTASLNYLGDGLYSATDGSWTARERTVQGTLNGAEVTAACLTKAVQFNGGFSGWEISFDPTEDFSVTLTLADTVEMGRTYELGDLAGVGRGAPGYLRVDDRRVENEDELDSILDPYFSYRSLPADGENADWRSDLGDAALCIDFVDTEHNMLGATLSFSTVDYFGDPLSFSGVFVAPLPGAGTSSGSFSYHSVDTTTGTVELPESTSDMCQVCHDVGYCKNCNGKGYISDFSNNTTYDCPACNHGECPYCGRHQ